MLTAYVLRGAAASAVDEDEAEDETQAPGLDMGSSSTAGGQGRHTRHQ